MLTSFLNSGLSAHMIAMLAGLGMAAGPAVWVTTRPAPLVYAMIMENFGDVAGFIPSVAVAALVVAAAVTLRLGFR